MGSYKGWDGLLVAISDVFGWTYFLSWSLSFYPQPLLNYQRRSTGGLTVDYPFLNVLGFSCYTIYTSALLFSTTVRQQYAARHPRAPNSTVRANDFAFALHALILCIITYSQLWSKLWGFTDSPGKRASSVTYGIFWGCIVGVSIVSFLVLWSSQNDHAGLDWTAIDVVYAASWVKLVVTCSKYVPQAWQNYQAKSTDGWAIAQVLLDLFGGVLSIVQMVTDSARQADWSGLTGNPVKLALGNVSIFFDIIFVLQHYVLYNKTRQRSKGVDVESREGEGEGEGERESLLRV